MITVGARDVALEWAFTNPWPAAVIVVAFFAFVAWVLR